MVWTIVTLVQWNTQAYRDRLPGPAPQRRGVNIAQENKACESCHSEIAQEWRSSLHRQSWTEPSFQRALAIEPLPFCQSCHAPEANVLHKPDAWSANMGVTCVTCHLVEHEIISGTSNHHPPQVAPHAVTRSEAFGHVGACQRCHEFQFPDVHRRTRTEFMQSTIQEHRGSTYRDVSCASCHMLTVGNGQRRHRSHAFGITRNEQALRQALTVKAQRTSCTNLEFTLIPNGVGHAFPTGDLFRRIEIRVEILNQLNQVQSIRIHYLRRHFEVEQQLPNRWVKTARVDNRIFGLTTFSVKLPIVDCTYRLRWNVTYQRVEHMGPRDETSATVAGEIVLATGVTQ